MHFRALRSRNFRLFFIGQTLSMTGTWIQQAAMGWLIYRLTGSSALLGIAYFLNQAPVLFMAPLVPRLCARFPRERLYIGVQASSMVYAFGLGALAWSGYAAAWNILLLSAVAGCVMAMDSPLRQGVISTLVTDPADLSNAVLLNSLLINTTRLVGPSIAGLLITTTDESTCFLVNGLSFVAVIVAVLKMKLPVQPKSGPKASYSMREGIAYARARPRIRMALMLLVVLAACFTPYFVVLPVYAKTIFGGDATILGNLMSSAGVGCLLGTVTLLWLGEKLDLTRLTLWSALSCGVTLAVFALNKNLFVAYGLLVLLGYGIILTGASLNVVLQKCSVPRYRPSVMSLYSMAYAGVIPFSSLALGWATDEIGTPRALHYWGLTGVGCTVLLMTRLPPLRRQLRLSWRKLPSLWRRGVPTLLSR